MSARENPPLRTCISGLSQRAVTDAARTSANWPALRPDTETISRWNYASPSTPSSAGRTAGRSPHLPCRVTHAGVAYLLLPQGPAILACVSGPLLLVFMTGTGIVLGTAGSTVPA
jgi:hypothetical protein